jgi:hypothetical protein
MEASPHGGSSGRFGSPGDDIKPVLNTMSTIHYSQFTIHKPGLTLALIAWWFCAAVAAQNVMKAQILNTGNLVSRTSPLRDKVERGEGDEEAVSVLAPGMGTAPTGQPIVKVPDLDSLELRIFNIEIEQAKTRVEETSFWRRAIPQIHFSGSYGVRDLVFLDIATSTQYVIPHDAYRLTISWSIIEIFDPSEHAKANLELERALAEKSYRSAQQLWSRSALELQLRHMDEQIVTLQEDSLLVRELLNYNELLFGQGKIAFDVLIRSRLQFHDVRKAIQKIRQQRSELDHMMSSNSDR